MKQKEFEEFIENCESLIEERSNLAFKKVAQSKNYKEKYKKYNELYELLVDKIGADEIEKFADSIHLLNDLENNYIYIQGLADGLLLRENLE